MLTDTARFWVQSILVKENYVNARVGISQSGDYSCDNMKIELVDAIVVFLAIFFLAAYIKLGSAAFLYATALLILSEIFVIFWGRRKRPAE